MYQQRPDPDILLEELKTQSPSKKGRLKIFLGYAAGVGKTFSMLQAAQVVKKAGADVVAGYVEPHDRTETSAQLGQLEVIPPREISFKNIFLKDLDLDACLKRRPEILLVDELAHTNAPGMRHEKRWQDIQEILDQGISVYTTLNIQHLDSMNDVVAKFSGVLVQETIPDLIFDQAEEVEVVDIPPEELLERMRQGKIYPKSQVERALNNFFKKDNLLALREMALRRTADRVGRDVDGARERSKTQTIWPLRERLMISVSPSPTSENLLRAAARMAGKLDADLLAVYIETPANRVLSSRAKEQLQKNFITAEALGAETVILQGEDVAQDLVSYARQRNVTKLILGKNRDTGWKRWLKHPIGDEILRISGDIDVYIISGNTPVLPPVTRQPPPPLTWRSLIWSLLITSGFTALGTVFQSLGMSETNIVLTLLLSVVLTATLFGLIPSILTSVMAVLAYNFFFTQPLYSLSVENAQYYMVFLFLLMVGVVIGTLTDRLQSQTKEARSREQRMEALYRLGRELSQGITQEDVIRSAETMISGILETQVRVLIPSTGQTWKESQFMSVTPFGSKDHALFSWVLQNNKKAGWSTSTLNEAPWLVWPLSGSQSHLGVLIIPRDPQLPSFPEEKMVLAEALAASVALTLERVELIQESKKNSLEMETERTRNTLLQGLSHDLRTPLAVISGTASTLIKTAESRLSTDETQMLETIFRESQWMGRQVENLLSLSKFTNTVLKGNFQWIPMEEILLSCLSRFREIYPGIPLKWDSIKGPDLCRVDPVLLDQALFNLLENGALYGDEKQGLEISFETKSHNLRFLVKDRGQGILPEEKSKIFEKFTRGSTSHSQTHRGSGLGLALVQTITKIHGGTCGVSDRPEGGSIFWISIPQPQDPPPGPPKESL